MNGKITIKSGSLTSRDAVVQSLSDADYHRVGMVIERGTFSVKGSILDVFPINHNQPVRLDFFSDELAAIHSFRVDTQRTLSVIDSVSILPVDGDVPPVMNFENRVLNTDVMSNIQDGDYIVHERYGVGMFRGFQRLTVGDQDGEYILIHFKGSDKLYMPLDQVPLIHRYAGSHATPRLNGLYDGGWERTRKKAHRALTELAQGIYDMAKRRQRVPGFAFSPDTEDQLTFELKCPFKETPDQTRAIQDVKSDMEASTPMDRLVCGDVGFGKTEVILRAAAKAVFNLKQVIVLVPTTILCDQHYKTFKERFNGTKIVVQSVSRLRSTQHNRQVIQGVKDHTVDIVIGTHRLLSRDVVLHDLGLVIVDEEQRFGVTHKEKIKKMAEKVDILTTSATPIPRTLYMSLTGARAISSINTPPPGRKPIQTIIQEYSLRAIRAAIKREMDRGGQVYFLHNHIDELPMMASQLVHQMPGLRVQIAHGQMNASELEATMMAFYAHEFDVLLCTTIIENGLDIQTANTIIINRADRLGLSQIHQIRGRVGRCATQAYAYILFPSTTELGAESKDRLQALKEAVGLGVGYQLAMKDLEIRGAGTLLGEKQSGHLTAIGFDLYCKLLDQNLKKIRGERVDNTALISLKGHPNVFIPSHYIPDANERLAMYQRLLGVSNRMGLKRLQLECIDRYGKLPKRMTAFIESIGVQCSI
jgi:transcription-repair coupling factor (superfamily II helicase)